MRAGAVGGDVGSAVAMRTLVFDPIDRADAIEDGPRGYLVSLPNNKRRRRPMANDALRAKAERFQQLHKGPELLVLANSWDVASSRLVEAAGLPAVATSSAAIAWALGYADGEHISRDEMADMVRRIRGGRPRAGDRRHGGGLRRGARGGRRNHARRPRGRRRRTQYRGQRGTRGTPPARSRSRRRAHPRRRAKRPTRPVFRR